MLIDWFTVIAQVVNFLILVFLLKRFLYKPILNAIDEREKRIATELEEAAKQQSEAQGEHQKYQQLHDDLTQKKEALLATAQKDAEAERQRLTEAARKESDELRTRLQESLQTEQSNLSKDLKGRAQREVFDIARKVLTDLAGTSLEAQITGVFIEKIAAMDKEEKAQLLAALKPTGQPITVSSAFELAADQQAKIKSAVAKLLGEETELQFRTAPDEVGGIELSANSFKIAWTIAEYLGALEKRITALPEAPENNLSKTESHVK